MPSLIPVDDRCIYIVLVEDDENPDLFWPTLARPSMKTPEGFEQVWKGDEALMVLEAVRVGRKNRKRLMGLGG